MARLALLLAFLAVAASLPPPASAAPTLAGYVYADSKSRVGAYQPGARWNWNSAGGANTVNRTSAGRYTVRFPGLGAGAFRGAVMVTAYGSVHRWCKAAGYSFSAGDAVLRVACGDAANYPKDAEFTASFSNGDGAAAGYAHVYADRPSMMTYTPAVQKVPTALKAYIVRTAPGRYTVSLPGFSPGGQTGTVKVTAVGGGNALCRTLGWGGALLQVTVACHSGGVAVDSAFSLVYAYRRAITGVPSGMRFAYALADKLSTPSYTPTAAYQFNSATNLATTNTVQRLGVGRYRLTHGLVAPAGAKIGVPHVSAHGSGTDRCQIFVYSPGSVDVWCFTRDGVPVDARFTLQFAL
ncbi:hypothetical protein DFJ74DRAFT_645276 [Hyaloraphidium curvatum]|nr:hypothetical protein DFJ74DRAFT_645276 [Hyaloraphidium curvatum]